MSSGRGVPAELVELLRTHFAEGPSLALVVDGAGDILWSSATLQAHHVSELLLTPGWPQLRAEAGSDSRTRGEVRVPNDAGPQPAQLSVSAAPGLPGAWVVTARPIAAQLPEAAPRMPVPERPLPRAGEGYLAVLADGRIATWNKRFLQLWSLSEEQVRGRTIAETTEIMTTRLRRPTAEPRFDPHAEAQRRDFLLASGRTLERYRTEMPTDSELAGTVFFFFRDVTVERRAEAEVRLRMGQQALVAELGQRALDGLPADKLASIAVTEVARLLGLDMCEVFASAGGALLFRVGKGTPDDWVGLLVPGTGSHAGYAWRTGLPTVVADYRTDGRFQTSATLVALGLVSGAAVRIGGHERPWGVLVGHRRSGTPFSDDDVIFLQSVANLIGSAADREAAEARVRQSEEQLRSFIENTPDAMLLLRDGRIEYANAATVRLFGVASQEALLGHRFDEFLSADEVASLLESPGHVLHELRIARSGPGGGEREVLTIEARALALPGGAHVASLRDVTERQALQARLQLTDRLASVGTLAAGMAHELNNPLAYVMGNLSYARDWLFNGGPAAERSEVGDALTEAIEGAERMRAIIRELKSLSRTEDAAGEVLDLNRAAEVALKVAANELRHRARVVRQLSDVAPVQGNEARLVQVFINLFVNAAHAIPEGNADRNTITVSTRRAGDWVVAEVRDTGSGIPPEILARIFDPFFTTKRVGEGTGLGLSICHGIVTGMRGEISVESEPGRGTTFRVSLPVHAEAAKGPSRPSHAVAAAAPSRGRVLVVDDDPHVGAVIRRALSQEHEVTVVTSGRAALELLRGEPAFDVILSDLLMPEMTGMELFGEVQRLSPAIAAQIVFLTGGAFTPGAQAFLEKVHNTCLEKPFDPQRLRREVAERLRR